MINGIIVQVKEDRDYKGVEGDNWFYDNEQLDAFRDYYDDSIDLSWDDTRYVDVCNNIDYIRRYTAVLGEQNINFRLLLCETEKDLPIFDSTDIIDKKFLGYDYAYPGGSYYSAVYNDFVLRKFDEFSGIKLNENGLLLSEEDLDNFIKLRTDLKDKYSFENGDFIKYKLYEVMC